MYNNETKDRFIELRADGLSLAEIAQQLNISKRTLVNWNRNLHSEIRALRAVQIEDLHEKIFANHELEAKRLAELQTKVETEIERRHFKYLDERDLVVIRASDLVRRQISRYRKEVANLYPPSTQQPESATAVEVIAPAQVERAQSQAA